LEESGKGDIIRIHKNRII